LLKRIATTAPIIVVVVLAACGAPATPTASATAAATVAPTVVATATPTPAPASTAAASVDELTVVASTLYPACTPANCAGDAMFTTCDASSSGPDVFAPCPLTMRLVTQLKSNVNGVASAPDPIGGGQDPEWITEAVTPVPSATGGVVHVTLGFGPGTRTERYDLVVVLHGSRLLVDDLYCTGTDPAGADAFASGWLVRSTC
jgi:hypothetical protein